MEGMEAAPEARDFGGVKEITIYKDYKNKIRDSFNDPFEALQELVDNGLAKGNEWNATHISLRMAKYRVLEYEDDGRGMTFADCKEAFQYGHKNPLPADSKYSRYGQGLKNSLTYLFPNSYVLSKARNEEGEVERTIVVFGDQVEPYTGECIGTARLLLPPNFKGTTRGHLIGAISDTFPESQDPASITPITEKCMTAYQAIFSAGSLLKDLAHVHKRFNSMPETGVQIFGCVREDVPLKACVNTNRPFPDGRENKPNDILNTESQKLLSDTIPLWYMPFAGHDLLPNGYVETDFKPQQDIVVNRVAVDWTKHPWTRGLAQGLVPSEAYRVSYETDEGEVTLAMVQAMELSKDSAECWKLWEADACGFLLYYNNRAIWREPKFPEDKRKIQESFLRKVQVICQREDRAGYGLLRKLVGKLVMEHPTEDEYARLRRSMKQVKYRSAFAGQLLMVRVFDDTIHMHDSKVSLRDSKEVTYLWDRVYQREIERCWAKALERPATDDTATQDSHELRSRAHNTPPAAASAGRNVDPVTLSCARAGTVDVDEGAQETQEGTSQPTTRTGRIIHKPAQWEQPERPTRKRVAHTKVASTPTTGKRKRATQAEKTAIMKELKQKAKPLHKRVETIAGIVESIKDHLPSLQKQDELYNALDDINQFLTWVSEKL